MKVLSPGLLLVSTSLPFVLVACANDRASVSTASPVAPQPLALRRTDVRRSNKGASATGSPVKARLRGTSVAAGAVASPASSGGVSQAAHTRVPPSPSDDQPSAIVFDLSSKQDVKARQPPLPKKLPPPLAPGASGKAKTAESAAASSLLKLSDLESIALESNPSLKQLAAVVEKARGIHEQVGLYPNPVVGYSGTEIGNEGSAGQQGGFLGQTIVTGNKLKLNREVASWNIQEFSWVYQAQRHRVLNDVRLRYYDVLGAQQQLKITGELLKVAEEGVKIAEQLRKAKQTSKADVLQARVDRNQIRIIRRNAQYAYDAAWKRLAALLGRPKFVARPLDGKLSEQAPKREFQTLFDTLLAESPQMQAIRARIQGARLAIDRQEAQPIPNLLTQIGVAHDYSSGDTITNLQIGIPLPVFNRNQGNIRLAQAEYQRAYRNAERLQLQLRDQLAVAYRRFQQAKYQTDQYKNYILKDAKESLTLTEESYKGGQINFLRVLTARRTYFEANLRYVEALIALRQANVVIDGFVLTGGLTDVPDIGSRALNGLGQRGQALGGQ